MTEQEQKIQTNAAKCFDILCRWHDQPSPEIHQEMLDYAISVGLGDTLFDPKNGKEMFLLEETLVCYFIRNKREQTKLFFNEAFIKIPTGEFVKLYKKIDSFLTRHITVLWVILALEIPRCSS